MSVLALLSFSPDLTVFLASNSVPGFITFSAEPTATLTGSTSAHAPGLGRSRGSFHCLSLTCSQLDQPAFGEIEQRRGEPVLGNRLGADVFGLHRPEPGGGAYCSGKPGDGSTVVRYHRNAPSPNSTVSAATHSTPVTDWPRMRSQVYGHGRLCCGGVGTSTPARTVTGVRGGRFGAEKVDRVRR